MRILQIAAIGSAIRDIHVIATQHRADDRFENRCLSCQSCNLHEGTNLATIDPVTNRIVRLFNPRNDDWHEHFKLVDFVVVGLTDIGRATVNLLAMNAPQRIQLRRIRRVQSTQ